MKLEQLFEGKGIRKFGEDFSDKLNQELAELIGDPDAAESYQRLFRFRGPGRVWTRSTGGRYRDPSNVNTDNWPQSLKWFPGIEKEFKQNQRGVNDWAWNIAKKLPGAKEVTMVSTMTGKEYPTLVVGNYILSKNDFSISIQTKSVLRNSNIWKLK